MQPAYAFVQSLHSIADFQHEFPQEAKYWKETSNSIIALSVKDEQSLHLFCEKLKSKNIKFTSFFEPDIENQLTAICIEASEASRRITSSLPLVLKELNNPTGINKHSTINLL